MTPAPHHQAPRSHRIAARISDEGKRALDRILAAEPGLNVSRAIEAALIYSAGGTQ